MVGQWSPIRILLPFTFSFICQHQALILVYNNDTANCIYGALSLTYTIDAPQNDEKCLHRFGTVWLHLWKYQKGGVSPVLLIPLSCLLVCRRVSFQCN